MAQRVGWVVVLLGAGCVFTPRPMIPFADDAGGQAGAYADAGRAQGSDAATTTPSVDASAPELHDAASADGAPGPTDSRCLPSGDGGYLDEAGRACDPSATRDGGAADASDAACDGATDVLVERDGAGCDAPGRTGVGRERR